MRNIDKRKKEKREGAGEAFHLFFHSVFKRNPWLTSHAQLVGIQFITAWLSIHLSAIGHFALFQYLGFFFNKPGASIHAQVFLFVCQKCKGHMGPFTRLEIV